MSDAGGTPAIRRRDSARPTLLVFEVTAKIGKADIEAMARAVEEAFDAYDKIDLLLLLTDFEGMTAGAAFDPEALTSQMRSVAHVRKYGVVGAPGWARAMIELSDLLSPVDAKTFDAGQETEARAWIES